MEIGGLVAVVRRERRIRMLERRAVERWMEREVDMPEFRGEMFGEGGGE
jgi:hypothetical protein